MLYVIDFGIFACIALVLARLAVGEQGANRVLNAILAIPIALGVIIVLLIISLFV